MHRGYFSFFLSLLSLAGAVGARAAKAPIALPPATELLEVHLPSGLRVPFETTFKIFRDGTEFLFSRALQGAPELACKVYWGRLTPEALSRLNAALAAGRVGFQSGRCGGPASTSGPAYVGVRWFGQNGRSSFFEFGTGTREGCPEGILEIVDALPLFTTVEAQLLTDCPLPEG